MTPKQFARVEELFERASEQRPEQRGAWLRGETGDDAEVLQKVEGMLREDAQTAQRLEMPALGAGFHIGHVDDIERRIRSEFAESGRYRIVELLGEGGFGIVYRAEQQEPVRRDVALKVIKLGMDTRRVLARFEAERQTLAIMNHPGIAKFFDAGVTPSGRPYFVMELVEGTPITRYCDDSGLGVRERLELFLRVCEAVRHAHQKGVLHRDIKPSNALVASRDGTASPVIIDFGISRALIDEESGTSMTEQGQMLGTPEYMSPEQACGEKDIDTRTDVYALGVMLYELATGTTPFERTAGGAAGIAELQRLLKEQEPMTPSSRVRTAVAKREMSGRIVGADPAALARTLRGDLDWIIMKAIEKDRSRRYESVDAFAADVTRYLYDEAVLARPPSATYRFGKFARRNRGTLAAAGAIVLLLVAGVIGTGTGMVRARREAEIARNESAVARAVTEFLNDDLFSSVAPDEMGNDVSMRQVIEAAARRLEGKFPGQPLAEAAVHLSLGRTFSKLSDLSAAQRHLERAVALRTQALGPDALETLEAEHERSMLYKFQDRNMEAEAILRRVYAGRLRKLGEGDAATISTLYELSVALGEQGQYEETERLMRQALELSRRWLGEDHAQTLSIVRGLGVLYASVKQPEKAAPYYVESYEGSRRVLGAEHPTTLLAMKDLASAWISSGRAVEAEKLLIEAMPISKRLRGEDHPATLMIACNLATAREALGRGEQAESDYRRALATAERTLPPGHTLTTTIQLHLASYYTRAKRFDEAEPLYLKAVEGRERLLGAGHPWTLDAVAELVGHFEMAGDAARAEPWKDRLRAATRQEARRSR